MKSLFDTIQKNIILNRDSDDAKLGKLPIIYSHEVKHDQFPKVKDIDLTGIELPEKLKQFLEGYPEGKRSEELAAEIFAGDSDLMDAQLRNKLSRRLNKALYGF